MNIEELRKKLAATREAIKALSGVADPTDEQAKDLTTLLDTAAKLELQVKAAEQIAKAADEDKAAQEKAIADAVKAAEAKKDQEFAAAGRRLPGGEGNGPFLAQFSDTWKYDGLDTAELSLLIDTLEAGKGKSARAVGARPEAFRALMLRMGELPEPKDHEERKGRAYVMEAFKNATKIDPTKQAIEQAIKAATDPMYTGSSGAGSDWVGAAYSQELWRMIRARVAVVERIPADVVPDGYSSKTWPIESADPTFYKVAEATSSDATLKVPAATVTASQLTTANKQITLAKMGARVLYTGEMVEDSLAPFVATLKSQLELGGAEILESLFIDGDVETSANKNINKIDGTPTSTDYYLMFDGFRKLALITNTANARSAGGSLVIEDYKETLKLMGTAGLAASDPSKVFFVVDGNVHFANMGLPEVKTKDVSSSPTVENGFLKAVYSIDIIPSWSMHRQSAKRMAKNDGTISATDSNNTLGAIVAVRSDQWKQAYKRRMTMETTRIANADTWEIVALMRLGLANRDNEASAVTYNVGV